MNTYDFVHLALLAIGGQIQGKTKLQKTVYFLGKMTGHLDDLGYRPHYYGPYSADVSAATDRLLSLGFIDKAIRSGGMYDYRGFEVARYDYQLNDEGRRVAEAKMLRHPEVWSELQKAADDLKNIGDVDYVSLSVAAKTDFMLDQREKPTTIGQLTQLAGGFGWEVTADEVSAAANLLEKLGLAEVGKAKTAG